MGQFTLNMFKTIPPERVGIDGQYDHQGLAKRVSLALSQHFQPEELERLRVSQRGTVVVLIGRMPSHRSLVRLVKVVMSVAGTADVEINGVSVAECLRLYWQARPTRGSLLRLLRSINPH